MKNSMKTPDQKKRSKQLGKEIRDNLERYEYLRAHGGSDPFWSDGVNMNLCRKHVIYLRSRVETDLYPEYYPDEYGRIRPDFALFTDPEQNKSCTGGSERESGLPVSKK